MELDFDLESYNKALISRGLPPITAEEFYGIDEKKGPRPLTSKERKQRKKRRKMQKTSRRANRGK